MPITLANFDAYELLTVGALGYSAYVAYDCRMTPAAVALAGVAALNLYNANKTTDTFGAEDSTPLLGNFGGLEMISLAAAGYGTYMLFSALRTASPAKKTQVMIAAIASAIATLFLLYESSVSTTDDH